MIGVNIGENICLSRDVNVGVNMDVHMIVYILCTKMGNNKVHFVGFTQFALCFNMVYTDFDFFTSSLRLSSAQLADFDLGQLIMTNIS